MVIVGDLRVSCRGNRSLGRGSAERLHKGQEIRAQIRSIRRCNGGATIKACIGHGNFLYNMERLKKRFILYRAVLESTFPAWIS